MFRCSSEKMTERFSVIFNPEVTARLAVDYSREDFFLKGIFKSKQIAKSASKSKSILNPLNASVDFM